MRDRQQKILSLPQGDLSSQQRQIYKLYCDGFSNKEIAVKLNLDQRTVATQLSRIRKKAANLDFTYKIDPGAEHALHQTSQDSPACQLKKKIQDDPGFFSLLFNRYAGNEVTQFENRYQIASSGKDPALLFTARAKQIKFLALSGKDAVRGKVVVKIGKEDRHKLGQYFQVKRIKPMQIFWDDGSGVYLLTPREIKNIQQFLDKHSEN